jgi:hypothetical protein
MSQHGQALDTLRWGDSRAIVFTAQSGDNIPAFPIIQLVKAQWRWPLLWGLRLVIVPSFDATETAAFSVAVQVTLGAGQNSTTATFTYALTHPYPVCVNDFIELPASDIQVTATLTGVPAANDVQENVTIGAYVAPTTEPHAMTHLFEALVEKAPQGQRWMQDYPSGGAPTHPGTGIAFPVNPDPLHYQSRRGY